MLKPILHGLVAKGNCCEEVHNHRLNNAFSVISFSSSSTFSVKVSAQAAHVATLRLRNILRRKFIRFTSLKILEIVLSAGLVRCSYLR